MWPCLETLLAATKMWEGVAVGTWWAEARDAAKHLTVHRTASSLLNNKKNYPFENINSARVEKLQYNMILAMVKFNLVYSI